MIVFFAACMPYKYRSIFDFYKVTTTPTVSSSCPVETKQELKTILKCLSEDDHIYDPNIVTTILCSDCFASSFHISLRMLRELFILCLQYL